MSGMIEGKSSFASSISELESLGLVVPNLDELKYSHEVEKIAEIIKQTVVPGIQINACIHRLKVSI